MDEGPEEYPGRSRYEETPNFAATHPFIYRLKFLTRTDGYRAGLHVVFGGVSRVCVAHAQASEDYVRIVEDHAPIPPNCPSPLRSGFRVGIGRARRHGHERGVSDAWRTPAFTLGWERMCDPIDFAQGVLVNVTAEPFEPPRGPGTHVSERIPAIDDHWTARIKLFRYKRGGQRLEREVHRTG